MPGYVAAVQPRLTSEQFNLVIKRQLAFLFIISLVHVLSDMLSILIINSEFFHFQPYC